MGSSGKIIMNSTEFTETLSDQQYKDTIWRINAI